MHTNSKGVWSIKDTAMSGKTRPIPEPPKMVGIKKKVKHFSDESGGSD